MRKTAVWILALALCLLLCPAAAFADREDAALPEIVDPYRLYTYEQMTADLASLQERYPALFSVSSIGQSVEGREIPVFRLGVGARKILICAAMHAREYETTNYVMYTAEQYCRGYESNGDFWGLSYRALLEGVQFIVVPMLNPDGVAIAQQGAAYVNERPALAAMKITDGMPGDYYSWKANANGVDLNRNWPLDFDVVNQYYQYSSEPASAFYSGPEPLSEPESQAMQRLIEETPFYAFCSFHSAGNCVYWSDAANPKELLERVYPVAERVANACGYQLMPGDNIKSRSGCMINYARSVYEVPCLTVELGPYTGRYPYPDYGMLKNVIDRAYPIGLLLADETLRMPERFGGSEADAAVSVTLNGVEVDFPDVRPLIENGRTLTPIRAVCEAAGLSVGWSDGVVTVTDGARLVILTVGEPSIMIDGVPTPLDCAPVLRDERVLIPIRAVMEAFGLRVEWDSETRTVTIVSPAAKPPDAETVEAGAEGS